MSRFQTFSVVCRHGSAASLTQKKHIHLPMRILYVSAQQPRHYCLTLPVCFSSQPFPSFCYVQERGRKNIPSQMLLTFSKIHLHGFWKFRSVLRVFFSVLYGGQVRKVYRH
uniref:Uncharacterized protein n=1 Tax=Schistocephalus solidus TaxID=70667 RepID=A0A0X3P9H1_SCHSO